MRTLDEGAVYHVMNKSIAGYKIFHTQTDYKRMIDMISFFALEGPMPKFSLFRNRHGVLRQGFRSYLAETFSGRRAVVQIVSFCLMPTHVHFVVKQLRENGISSFMKNISNAYTRYFNTKHARKGPLWVGRFKAVNVESDEQLLHLTRYVHLNPTTAALVKKPEQWLFSSYSEFIEPDKISLPICNYAGLFDLSSQEYRSFVDDYKDYQRELGIIKKLVLD